MREIDAASRTNLDHVAAEPGEQAAPVLRATLAFFGSAGTSLDTGEQWSVHSAIVIKPDRVCQRARFGSAQSRLKQTSAHASSRNAKYRSEP